MAVGAVVGGEHGLARGDAGGRQRRRRRVGVNHLAVRLDVVPVAQRGHRGHQVLGRAAQVVVAGDVGDPSVSGLAGDQVDRRVVGRGAGGDRPLAAADAAGVVLEVVHLVEDAGPVERPLVAGVGLAEHAVEGQRHSGGLLMQGAGRRM